MNQTNQNITADKIHLLGINVFKSNLETTNDFLNEPSKIDGFEFGIAQEMADNINEKRIRIRLFVTLNARNTDGESLGLTAEYGIEFHFHIEDLESFLLEDNNQKKLNIDVASMLTGIAYSTARGIVLERTQGTFFKGVILPVVNPFSIINEH